MQNTQIKAESTMKTITSQDSVKHSAFSVGWQSIDGMEA